MVTTKRFRVLVNGENCWVESEGGPKRVGFFVTRIVEAATAEDAARLAVERVSGDPELARRLLNASEDPPQLLVDRIAEAPPNAGETGFAFYEEDEAPLH